MNDLHHEFDLQGDDLVEISLNSRANVLLLDPENFGKYRQGLTYRYFGGFAENSPVLLTPPSTGRWHVVVNLGGYPGSVRAEVRVLSGEGALR